MCSKMFFLSIKPELVDSCEVVAKKLSVIRKRYAGKQPQVKSHVAKYNVQCCIQDDN